MSTNTSTSNDFVYGLIIATCISTLQAFFLIKKEMKERKEIIEKMKMKEREKKVKAFNDLNEIRKKLENRMKQL